MAVKSVDNDVYNVLSDTWWDERSVLNLLRTTVNPWRVPYYKKAIEKHSPAKTPVLLDVGCGGGLLAEEFAKLKCKVTGIDPSESSLKTARAHAKESKLEIKYDSGFGDALPYENASFDVVSCSDVLEHIENWDKAVSEIARVLKPKGLFVFDTINRTPYSWLVHILVAQDLPYTRFMPKDLHVWRMFITPQELKDSLLRHGFGEPDFVGSAPKGNPLSAISAIRGFKAGKLTAEDVGEKAQMRPSRNMQGSYMGYAVKKS